MFAKFSPEDNNRLAYVRERNVYVENLATGKVTALTKRVKRTVINGTFDWVYEEELGLRDGFRWSPDGKSIAYWQLDEDSVKEMTMLNHVPGNYPQVIQFRYPKVGETNSRCRIGVVPVAGGETTWVQVAGDSREHYLARMEWADNSEQLLIQRLNRLQNRNTVLLAEAATGKSRAVYTDKDDAWIEVRFGFTDWVNDRFTYVSEREGWRQLYLVSRDGEAKKVTRGKYDIVRMLKVDAENDCAYFMASPKTPPNDTSIALASTAKGSSACRRRSSVGRIATVFHRTPNGQCTRFRTSSRRRLRN